MPLVRRWKQQAGLNRGELCLILVESLQWMAHNAVYFLGLIAAATYDLGGTAFLVAGVTLVHNLTTSLGNATSGPVVDRLGPRTTAVWTLVASVVGALVRSLAKDDETPAVSAPADKDTDKDKDKAKDKEDKK